MRQQSLLGSSFLESPLAPRLCRVIPANLIFSFGYESRYFDRLSIPVDRDESQIAGIRVTPASRLQIFRFDAHADFHGSAADIVHAALHYHEIAEVDWLAEIDPVDRGRDTSAPRVPDRTDG